MQVSDRRAARLSEIHRWRRTPTQGASTNKAPCSFRLAVTDKGSTQRIVTNEAPAVVLHIEGWGMPPDAERSASSHVWISVNRSWQAAWR